MDAIYLHGQTLMVQHTPALAVAGGDVVVIGDVTAVAHKAIPANTLGALAARGGVYRGTADGALAPGEKVYWDAANAKFSKTAGSAPHFGFVGFDSSAAQDGDSVEVVHDPDGSATASE